MKKNLLTLIIMSTFVTPVIAEKPEWAGKGKPTAEQQEAHRSAMEAKQDIPEEDLAKEKKEKQEKKEKKEKNEKTEREQKELDKGSDKGKESREANSKKWWKFWSE